MQENKQFGSHYAEVSVERTHSQIRNPSWVSFPVLIYRKIRNWGVVILKLVSNAPILHQEKSSLDQLLLWYPLFDLLFCGYSVDCLFTNSPDDSCFYASRMLSSRTVGRTARLTPFASSPFGHTFLAFSFHDRFRPLLRDRREFS